MLRRVKITNDPIFTDVERYVIHLGFNKLDAEACIIDIKYRIQYIKDGVDISNMFSDKLKPWIIDNSYNVNVLDANGEPIPNPDWEPNYPLIDGLNDVYQDYPDNLQDQYINMPAFNYFLDISFFSETPVDIGYLLEIHTVRDDLNLKRFDRV